jgi:cytochrome subunit of sulfide dehydrogenase
MRIRTVLAVAALAGGLMPLGHAQQAAAPAPGFAPPNLTAKGVRGLAANCAACHGTQGRAAPGASVPGLAGRGKDEIAAMMAQFKSGQRPATVMHQIAKGYSDDEIAAMADYFSRQAR